VAGVATARSTQTRSSRRSGSGGSARRTTATLRHLVPGLPRRCDGAGAVTTHSSVLTTGAGARQSNGVVEMETTDRDLGFLGVPSKAMVLVQPTVHTLVHLTELPFMVITLDDVELVSLERVQVRVWSKGRG
jgi:hypothetical protein